MHGWPRVLIAEPRPPGPPRAAQHSTRLAECPQAWYTARLINTSHAYTPRVHGRHGSVRGHTLSPCIYRRQMHDDQPSGLPWLRERFCRASICSAVRPARAARMCTCIRGPRRLGTPPQPMHASATLNYWACNHTKYPRKLWIVP